MIDICCVGHITLDKITTPTLTQFMPGGTAYYFAEGIHHLGTRSFQLVTAVGESELPVIRKLRDAGISIKLVRSQNSVFFENIYGEDQNNRTQRVRSKAAPFTIKDLEDINARIYHLGSLLADDFAPDLIPYLHRKGKVSLDVQGLLREVRGEDVFPIDWKAKRELLPYVDILKVNEYEMEVLTGCNEAHEAARRLADWGCNEVCITDGSYGSLIYAEGEFFEIPAYTPTRILFGAGALSKLTGADIPARKVLLVTGIGGSLKRNGTLDKVEAMLSREGIEFVRFPSVEPNPSDETVMKGAEAARNEGCGAILAVGGGSVMDAAKLMAAMATNEGTLWDYAQAGTGGRKAFEKDPLPLIAVTTTAGTGSEVDAGGVITNHVTKEKLGFGDPRLFPTVGVVDPELMLTVPPAYTAYQGFDALFHAVEGYVSGVATPMSDVFAKESVRLLAANLPVAVRDGANLEARSKVALASTLSGLVMVTGGLTSQHALEHSLSALHTELPHGAGLILLSLHYFGKMIEKGASLERFVTMAQCLGHPMAERPEDFHVALANLQKACDVLDLDASAWGFKAEDVEWLVENVLATGTKQFKRDAVPFTREDLADVFAKTLAPKA